MANKEKVETPAKNDGTANAVETKTLIVDNLERVFADFSRTKTMNAWKECKRLEITDLEKLPETFTASGGREAHGKKVFKPVSEWTCSLEDGKKAKAVYVDAVKVEQAGKLAIPLMVEKLDTLNKLQS